MIFAGAGFAAMAWDLAHIRTNYPPQRQILDRLCARTVADGPSAEFYRIIDSATAAWSAFARERALGISTRICL